MFKQIFNIILKKNKIAPALSWKTSFLGSSIRRLGEQIADVIHPNEIVKKFTKVMQGNPTQNQVDDICRNFSKETGINLYMTNPQEAYCFQDFASVLLHDLEKGRFPKDIKYVIFGHGSGTSLIDSGKDAWHVAGNSKIGIFDFIEENIPKGKKVLVNCCEETPKQFKNLIPVNKPAIGNPVHTDATSSYKYPLKIVESGRREIIGAYANGIATLY